MLTRPQLQSLRAGDIARVYMAGGFVWGISPIKGAEILYEVYLLKRLGHSAGEASTVVVTRVLLDIPVLILGAFGGLFLTSNLPEVRTPTLLLAGLAIVGALATILFLASKGARWKLGGRKLSSGESGRWARGRAKTRRFFGEMRKSLALFWRQGYRVTLIYGCALTIVYWAFRVSFGPLALMATGWSGDWTPVVVAQLLLFSFVLPLTPTPRDSGAREVGFVALMPAYVPEGQLLSATIVYAGLTHYLPVIVGAFFVGRQLWQEPPAAVRAGTKRRRAYTEGANT